MEQLQETVAATVARICARQGVRRVFGVPGGGSSLDLIEAFAAVGIDFVLCRTETGAALAAAADAEIRHGFGVAITTQGPGAASAMNGIAHAWLDRAPVLFISDGWTAAQSSFDTHQVFDQLAMSRPVVKVGTRLEMGDPAAELMRLIATMRSAPWGPAHLELTGENARRRVDLKAWIDNPIDNPAPAAGSRAAAQALLSASRRPVILVGVEARDVGAPERLRTLAERLGCPVLPTYKGKGILPDDHPAVVGHFTGGAAEQDAVSRSDLILLVGFDPVELIGKPWPFQQPAIDVSLAPHPVHYLRSSASCFGPLAASLDGLIGAARPSAWTAAEIAGLRDAMRVRLASPAPVAGLSPQQVVDGAWKVLGAARPAVTVDAGAHMFSAMAFWPSKGPGEALISNGLATMGFALPAGIAAALAAPERGAIAFTGDGGLLMCAGELATAAASGAHLCVVVFNDGALSLIALKQQNRGMAEAGVSWRPVDFAAMAEGLGLKAFRADSLAAYETALAQAWKTPGASLIDVRVDPSGYRAQAKALRG